MRPPTADEGTEPRTVNLLGCPDQCVTAAADIAELKRLLHRIGVRVGSVLLHRTSLADIRQAPRAELNLVLEEEFALPLAKSMQRKFSIPYMVPGFPLGWRNTALWLDEVNRALSRPIPDLERVLEDERRRLRPAVRALTGAVTVPPRIAVCAEPTLAAGLAAALDELGMDVVLVALRTLPRGGMPARLKGLDLADDPPVLLEPEPDDLDRALRREPADLLFASTMERFTARAAGVRLVECIYPAVFTAGWDAPLAGFSGCATLARLAARWFLDQAY